MVLLRILKETGGYPVGDVVDLPPESFAGWIEAGFVELVRPELETTEARPAPEQAVPRRRRPR